MMSRMGPLFPLVRMSRRCNAHSGFVVLIQLYIYIYIFFSASMRERVLI